MSTTCVQNLPSFEEKLLQAFAENLAPTQDYINQGNLAIQNVIEALKKEQTSYTITRVCIAGSIGKHTALKDSDFDVVLFINDIQPTSYKDVLILFKKILKGEEKNLKITEMKKGKFSLQLKLEDKFQVDLVVAANLATDPFEIKIHGVYITQQIESLRRIADNPSAYYDYSSSLAESQTQFMAKQDSFTHSLVRLCKFWLKQLNVGNYRSGVKSCIELIAVYSAQLRPNGDTSMLGAFRLFLINVKEIDHLKIYFKADGKSTFDYSTVPWAILQKGRFILDPANPFNELTKEIDPPKKDLYPSNDLSEEILKDSRLSTKLKNYAYFVLREWNKWPNFTTQEFFVTCAKLVEKVPLEIKHD